MSCVSNLWPQKVKITHGRSRCVINIPIKWAKELGLDKAEYVLVVKKSRSKLEIKRYEGVGSLREYVEENLKREIE